MIIGSRIKRGAARENPNLTMGNMSAKKEPRAFTNFDTTTPLDHMMALQSMKDNKNLFYMFLNRFRTQTLITHLNQITLAMDSQNMSKLNQSCHALKASAGYIGAGLIHYDCYFMQDFYAKKDYNSMRQRYSRLIENSCEFISFSKEFM